MIARRRVANLFHEGTGAVPLYHISLPDQDGKVWHVEANTRSEARGILKKRLGIRTRLPIGTIIVTARPPEAGDSSKPADKPTAA